MITGLSAKGRIALLSLGAVLGIFQLCDIAGIRINTSPSLPLGLYRVSSNPNANLIEFCPTDSFGRLAITRGYRTRGSCSDGAAPLLKPIVAKPGDLVELSLRGIAVNGKLLPNTEPRSSDTEDRPLVSWPFGRYSVRVGQAWVASSYNPRSFDSRYFGPVPVSSIRDRVEPFLTSW